MSATRSSRRLLILADHPSLHRGFATVAREIAGHLHRHSDWQVEYGGYYAPRPGWCSPGYKVVDLEAQDDFRERRVQRLQRYFQALHADGRSPDLLLCIGTLFDLFATAEALATSAVGFARRSLAYTPVDYAPLPVALMDVAERFDAILPYSAFARRAMLDCARRAGARSDRILQPIGHGVDTQVFRPLAEAERLRAREALFGIGPEQVLISYFGRNSGHKRADIVLRLAQAALCGNYGRCPRCGRLNTGPPGRCDTDWTASAACRGCGAFGLVPGEPRDDLRFYLHTDLADAQIRRASGGRDLEAIRDQLGLGEQILFNPALRIGHGEDTATLARRMAASDIHLLPSDRAGWELTALETGACGVANILTDFATPPEYARPYSRLIPPAALLLGGEVRALIDTDLALAALLELADRPRLRHELAARGPAAAARYAWPRICRQWQDLLDTQADAAAGVGA